MHNSYKKKVSHHLMSFKCEEIRVISIFCAVHNRQEIVGDVKSIFTEKNWSIESKEIKLKEDFGDMEFLKPYLIAKSFTFQRVQLVPKIKQKIKSSVVQQSISFKPRKRTQQ